MRLNLGCGDDIRTGWINVDAWARPGVLVWNLAAGLPGASNEEPVEEIAAMDILEHLHHWESERLLRECFQRLSEGGILTAQVPNVISVVKSELSWEKKLAWLYGGQDIPQGKSEAMEFARESDPNLFCHRWGWTHETFKAALLKAGFVAIQIEQQGLNMIARAIK